MMTWAKTLLSMAMAHRTTCTMGHCLQGQEDGFDTDRD